MAAIALLRQLRERNDQREQQVMQQQERMRQEQMQQQEQMRQEMLRKQENAAHQGISLLQSGAKLKDVETAVGGDVNEQGRALWRIIDTTKKRQEQEAKAQQESQSAGSAIQDLLTQAGGNRSAIDPKLMEDLQFRMLTGQLESGGDTSQATEGVDLLTRLAQERAKFAQLGAVSENAGKLDFERQKSNIAEDRSLRIDATQRERNAQDRAAEERRQSALKLYTAAYKDSLISENGSDPSSQSRILSAIESDPALGGKNAAVSANVVMMNALSEARGAQDAVSVARDIEKNTGIRIPLRIGQQIVDGKAVEEPLTGLPFRLPDGKNAARIGMIQNAVDALARIETYGKRIASSGKVQNASFANTYNLLNDKYSTGTVEARTNNTVRNLGGGIDDPDIAAYDAAREAFALAYTYIVTGATTNEKQIQSVQAQLPKLSELVRDQRTGGLNPGARRRLDGSFRNLMTQVLQSSLVGADITQERFRGAFDKKISEYDTNESAQAAPAAPGVPASPAQQGVQLPGARIRTGP